MEYGSPQKLPISQNIVKQMSLSTVRSIMDAIVELITNSDDSYNRLEQNKVTVNGNISMLIHRLKGGSVQKLIVRDNAEGMDRTSLEMAIKFAEPASGMKEGKTVRGYFGRGLKEAIISLGKGRIDTIKDNIYDSAEVWWDKQKNEGQYRILKQAIEASADIRRTIGIPSGNGTIITIEVHNPEITCPDYKSFKHQFTSHYALRDINSSPGRNVKLVFDDWKGVTTTTPISYSPPIGELIDSKSVSLQPFNDKMQVEIFKSEEQLDSPRNNPYAKAGFLIKTEGAILDLQLFKFDDNEAGLYFFGNVFCPGIAKMLRSDEQGLIDANRGGLAWKHPYCQRLRTTVEVMLAPFVKQKEKELEKKVEVQVPENTKKALNKLCNLLNRFAKDEIELAKGIGVDTNIFELMIKPEYANLEINVPRLFSIYVPQDLWDLLDEGEKLRVESSSSNIYVTCSEIATPTLSPHPKYPSIVYGHFEAFGDLDGATGKIICGLGQYSAFTTVKVAPPKKSKRKKTLSGKWGGLFSEIVADETLKPLQRVKYEVDTGEIRVFINFLAVSLYIGSGLQGVETPEGKTMLAELISEAFCRQVAIRRREMGKDPYFEGTEIDTYNSVINELQRKYLHQIHKAIAF